MSTSTRRVFLSTVFSVLPLTLINYNKRSNRVLGDYLVTKPADIVKKAPVVEFKKLSNVEKEKVKKEVFNEIKSFLKTYAPNETYDWNSVPGFTKDLLKDEEGIRARIEKDYGKEIADKYPDDEQIKTAADALVIFTANQEFARLFNELGVEKPKTLKTPDEKNIAKGTVTIKELFEIEKQIKRLKEILEDGQPPGTEVIFPGGINSTIIDSLIRSLEKGEKSELPDGAKLRKLKKN